MGLVFAIMSASVDGYISGPNGGPGQGLDVDEPIFDWFHTGGYPSREYEGLGFTMTPPNASVIDFAGARTGAVVAGRGTYEASGRWGGAGPHPSAPLFVLSHAPIPDAATGQTIVTNGIESAIAQAREVADRDGKDVAVMGGQTITSAIRAGLLDEIVINQRPVLLGGGVRLFGDLPRAVRLERTSVAVNHGVTHLTYTVLR
jgi:dihydrofolate reductase